MRVMNTEFTTGDALLITVGLFFLIGGALLESHSRSADVGTGQVTAPAARLESSPYSTEGRVVCEGTYDRVVRECAADQLCPSFVVFVDKEACVVHSGSPLDIVVPRGTRIRITLHRVDTYQVEPVQPAAETLAD
ncbi:MAG: hypothetical protein WCT10_05825 [Patescibacteria group bacterium]